LTVRRNNEFYHPVIIDRMSLSKIKYPVSILLIAMLLFNTGILPAQANSPKKELHKSGLLLKKAETAYRDMKYAVAAAFYENYLEHPVNLQFKTLQKLADCYWQIRDYENALRIYQQIYPKLSKEADKKDQIRIAGLYARLGDYQLAAEWLKGIAGYEKKAAAFAVKESLNDMKRDSLDWRLGFLNINSSYREFSPYYKNGNLLFSSNKAQKNREKAFSLDGNNYSHLWEIAVSKIDTVDINIWKDKTLKTITTNKKAERKLADIYEYGDTKPGNDLLHLALNQQYAPADANPMGNIVKGLEKLKFNAGSISIDKNNHIYFSANYAKPDRKGVNRIRLMEGIYSSKGIQQIKELPFGDARSYSVMHPAINADGTFLICSSDKKGGKGGFDLYYSKRRDIKQVWDTLRAFGNNINTAGNEVFPCITAKDYLFFSSDGLPGLGGLDIYRIRMKEALAQGDDVQQLSYPINSAADDFGWTETDNKGKKGYFTSDRLNSDDNLYSFSFNPRYSYFEGAVIDKESLYPIEGATVFMYSVKEDLVYVAKSNKNGKYRFPVFSTGKLILKAVDNKHLSDCLSSRIIFDPLEMDTTFMAPRDLLLDKYKIGFSWRITDTHYDFDKSNIRQDAMPILDSLVNLTYKYSITLDSLVTVLREKPITIEIGSHTDSRGTFEYNNRLSEERSKSVVEYLVKHNIDPSRIIAKGYGEYQLLNKCADGVNCTEAEHQVNRRTEAKITGFTTPQIVIEYVDTEKFKDGDRIDKSLLPKGFFDECK